MGQKLGVGLIGAFLLGIAALSTADFDGGIPFVSAGAAPTTPAYVNSIGTPAPVELPEVDMSTWFTATGEGDEVVRDPYDPAMWSEVSDFLAAAGTREGWAAVCGEAASVAGVDRRAEPLLGALACSDIPSITLAQQFAAQVLDAQAEVALWIRGARDATPAAVAAVQGKVRLMCTIDVIAREGPASPFAEACALALDTSYREGDGPSTFEALGQAYELAALEIAERDPDIESEPGFYGPAEERE